MTGWGLAKPSLQPEKTRKPRRKDFTQAELDAIVADKRPYKEIAAYYDASPQAIQRVKDCKGIMKSRTNHSLLTRGLITEKAILRIYTERDISAKRFAEIYGISRDLPGRIRRGQAYTDITGAKPC